MRSRTHLSIFLVDFKSYRKMALPGIVRYNACRPAGLRNWRRAMLEELIHKAESELERIQRLRGYL